MADRGLHGQSTRAVDKLAFGEPIAGKFGRMFPNLPVAVFGDDNEQDFPGSRLALRALAATMLKDDAGEAITEAEPEDENRAIPAGYTYLGQFIDHDISFDPSAVSDRMLDPGAVTDFRTPRFDLDSLYGRGPDDQPYLYKHPDYGLFHLGAEKAPGHLGKSRPDLPRNADERAVIGDPRNNENKLVTQVHALMLQFHNTVWNRTPMPGAKAGERFHEVRKSVRWHYQWLVVHDFLKKILHPDIWELYFGAGGVPKSFFYPPLPKPEYGPFIPLEFSVAAYRLGHSMVRPSYALSSAIVGGDKTRIPIFKRDAEPTEQLNGFQALPKDWGLDWGYFLDGVKSLKRGKHKNEDGDLEDDVVPQPSYRLDSLLVMPLGDLPDHHSQVLAENSLPALNLTRGRMLGLPSGQDAHKEVAKTVDVGPVMTNKELWEDKGNLDDATVAARKKLLDDFPMFKLAAPLWFYILREAEIRCPDEVGGGKHLGKLGSAIVAETFSVLLANDGESYVSEKAPAGWKPTLPSSAAGSFTFTDVVNLVDG